MLCTSGWTCQAFTAPWGQVHGVDDLTERGACLEGTHAVFVGGPRSIRRALEVRMDLADRDRGLVLSLEHAEGGEHLHQHDVPFFDRARLLRSVQPRRGTPSHELGSGPHENPGGVSDLPGAGSHRRGIDLVLADSRPGRF
jgi:hypothetical protein